MRPAILFLAVLLLAAQKDSRAPGPDYFESKVLPVLHKANCEGCHNGGGVAAGTRFKFPDGELSKEEWARFGLSLHTLVDRTDPAKSVLLYKPTKRVPHAGGQRIAPGSADEAVLQHWIDYLATNTKPTDTFVIAERRGERKPVLRRLTNTQYNNTVRDLLGDDTRIAEQFPIEDFVNGFRNQFQSQSVSPLLAEAYTTGAEKLAKSAFRGGDTRGLVPCKETTPACGAKFIREFGAKAFRRPVLETEVARYQKLWAAGGAQMVVEGMLQSPNFLLRTENGAEPSWRPYETASRLSYALWNSMPDKELFRAAAAGELATAEGVEKQARRMLRDQRARTMVDEFTSEWMRFDSLLGAVKERSSFPMYTPELAVAMTEEARKLVEYLVWDNRNFMEIYSADYAFVSTPLAKLYNIPAPATEFARVSLPPEAERAGVLGQALLLAATAKPADTSPTARGLFVREHFLCQEVPQPPPGVNANLPINSRAKPMTNRERLGVHLSNDSCASCHTLIDPIGFGFEKFDAVGQRREKLKIVFEPERKDKGEKETVYLDFDTSGYVAGAPNSAFRSPRELGTILAGNQQCQQCVVKQLFRYYHGRMEKAGDAATLRRSFDDFKKSGFHFQELMVSLLRWSIFPPES
ncbi:MAG TPA: DUF1592 domain-containing protein [Bryobacteraceae bacterium]|nr:DUF1592 domain-containing protein [Bryobacteraceae bacterium]